MMVERAVGEDLLHQRTNDEDEFLNGDYGHGLSAGQLGAIGDVA